MKTTTTPATRKMTIVLLIIIVVIGTLTAARAQYGGYNLKNRLYIGAELAGSGRGFNIASNLPQINNLSASFFGGTAGLVLGNCYGKVKANVGSFNSDPSVPYSIDLVQGSVSGNVYFLRFANLKAHLFEPYVSVGLSRQQTKFYGSYVPDQSVTISSSTSLPMIGEVVTNRAMVAAGVEYQLESDTNHFIHLFAEAGYGMALSGSGSNAAFSQTTTSASHWISVGVSFGIIK